MSPVVSVAAVVMLLSISFKFSSLGIRIDDKDRHGGSFIGSTTDEAVIKRCKGLTLCKSNALPIVDITFELDLLVRRGKLSDDKANNLDAVKPVCRI